MPFQEPLNDFESRLKKIALPEPSLDRDRLMYRCGQASQGVKEAPMTNHYWQLASASCLAFLFGAGIMFWNQQNDRFLAQERPSESHASQEATTDHDEIQTTGWSSDQLATLRSETLLRASSRIEDLAKNSSASPSLYPNPLDSSDSSSRMLDLYRQWEEQSFLNDR